MPSTTYYAREHNDDSRHIQRQQEKNKRRKKTGPRTKISIGVSSRLPVASPVPPPGVFFFLSARTNPSRVGCGWSNIIGELSVITRMVPLCVESFALWRESGPRCASGKCYLSCLAECRELPRALALSLSLSLRSLSLTPAVNVPAAAAGLSRPRACKP